MPTYNQSLKVIAPRHVEIMERLVEGQPQSRISSEMGIGQQRLSIIMNSPLFRLELRKRQIRREEKFLQMEETILEGAVLGVNKLKKIVSDDNPLHMKESFQSSVVLTNLGIKMMDRKNGSSHQPSNGDGETGDQSYEERLQKVTIEHSIRKVTPLSQEEDQLSQNEINNNLDAILDESHPPLLQLSQEEESFQEETDEQLRREVKQELLSEKLDGLN